MDDLVQFLRDRLDEDEQRARRAIDGPRNAFVSADEDVEPLLFDDDGAFVLPARVLTEVAAKREILALHRQVQPKWCSVCDIPGDYEGRPYGCTTIRLLTLPYADHPDYNEAWRP